jgi:hypothetical protein
MMDWLDQTTHIVDTLVRMAVDGLSNTQEADLANRTKDIDSNAVLSGHGLEFFGGTSRVAVAGPIGPGIDIAAHIGDFSAAYASDGSFMAWVQLCDMVDWVVPLVLDVLSAFPLGKCAEQTAVDILLDSIVETAKGMIPQVMSYEQGFSDGQDAQAAMRSFTETFLSACFNGIPAVLVSCSADAVATLTVVTKVLAIAASIIDVAKAVEGGWESLTTGAYSKAGLPLGNSCHLDSCQATPPPPGCANFEGSSGLSDWTCISGAGSTPCSTAQGNGSTTSLSFSNALATRSDLASVSTFDIEMDYFTKSASAGDFNIFFGAPVPSTPDCCGASGSMCCVQPFAPYCAINLYPVGSDSGADSITCDGSVLTTSTATAEGAMWHHVRATFGSDGALTVLLDGAQHMVAAVSGPRQGGIMLRTWYEGHIDNFCYHTF